MKKSPLILVVLLLASWLASIARAGYLFGGMTLSPIITAQSNTPCFYTNSGYLYLPGLTITNTTLSMTGAYAGVFQFSIDGANWYTNGSPIFIPTNTAAPAQYIIAAQSAPVPVLVRMLAITNAANTSAISIGATSP